jgi:hypothetical protein
MVFSVVSVTYGYAWYIVETSVAEQYSSFNIIY